MCNVIRYRNSLERLAHWRGPVPRSQQQVPETTESLRVNYYPFSSKFCPHGFELKGKVPETFPLKLCLSLVCAVRGTSPIPATK